MNVRAEMGTRHNLKVSIQRNLLSIISLLFALTSLSYNTWRNETSARNENQREAGFRVLTELAELQVLTDHITYGGEEIKGDVIEGWTKVKFICDLSVLVAPELELVSKNLLVNWTENVGALEHEEPANKVVSASIQSVRDQTLRQLAQLK